MFYKCLFKTVHFTLLFLLPTSNYLPQLYLYQRGHFARKNSVTENFVSGTHVIAGPLNLIPPFPSLSLTLIYCHFKHPFISRSVTLQIWNTPCTIDEKIMFSYTIVVPGTDSSFFTNHRCTKKKRIRIQLFVFAAIRKILIYVLLAVCWVVWGEIVIFI